MTMNKHRPKKQFGQNFLHDKNIINKICQALSLKSSDCVVEIGPGQGALTAVVAPQVAELLAIELDKDLIDLLQKKQKEGDLPNFKLLSQDALKTDFSTLPVLAKPFKLYGNLPYNISSPLLFQILKSIDVVEEMVFMLQKEVVDRIVASPGSKQYGRLSVMIQYYCEAVALFDVSKHCFYPKPKVESAVLKLTPRRLILTPANDLAFFAQIVREAFSERRKMISNTLKKYLKQAKDLDELAIDASRRAETLTVDDFVRLSNHLKPQ